MRIFKAMMAMAFVGALIAAPSGYANFWIVDFSDFEGVNDDAQIRINPPEPTEFWPIQQGVNWGDHNGIQQGEGPWGPTLLFTNGPGGNNIRSFNDLMMPDSWNLDNGVSVSWRVKIGAATPSNRNPIQIGATGPSGHVANNWVAVHHTDTTSTVNFLRNGGPNYSGLGDDDSDSRRILPLDIGNREGQWLQFSAALISVPEDETDGINWNYWKLWLTTEDGEYDRELLLFNGGGGSPVHPVTGEQFSFRQWPDGGNNRLRIAQADNSMNWDIEFDYISWTDEGAFYIDENEPVEMVEAPDFVGDGTLDEATVIAAIEDAGFTVGSINRQYSEDVPEGTVISQSPAPGSNIPEGSAINLVISRGPAPTELPLAPITTGIIAAVVLVTALKVRRMRVSA